MPTTRRHFLGLSASALAARTLAPQTPASSEAQRTAISAFELNVLRARPVPLSKVRVLGGPLKLAQDADAKYLLEPRTDRMMAYYRVRAGLPQKAQPYGGWHGGGPFPMIPVIS